MASSRAAQQPKSKAPQTHGMYLVLSADGRKGGPPCATLEAALAACLDEWKPKAGGDMAAATAQVQAAVEAAGPGGVESVRSLLRGEPLPQPLPLPSPQPLPGQAMMSPCPGRPPLTELQAASAGRGAAAPRPPVQQPGRDAAQGRVQEDPWMGPQAPAGGQQASPAPVAYTQLRSYYRRACSPQAAAAAAAADRRGRCGLGPGGGGGKGGEGVRGADVASPPKLMSGASLLWQRCAGVLFPAPSPRTAAAEAPGAGGHQRSSPLAGAGPTPAAATPLDLPGVVPAAPAALPPTLMPDAPSSFYVGWAAAAAAAAAAEASPKPRRLSSKGLLGAFGPVLGSDPATNSALDAKARNQAAVKVMSAEQRQRYDAGDRKGAVTEVLKLLRLNPEAEAAVVAYACKLKRRFVLELGGRQQQQAKTPAQQQQQQQAVYMQAHFAHPAQAQAQPGHFQPQLHLQLPPQPSVTSPALPDDRPPKRPRTDDPSASAVTAVAAISAGPGASTQHPAPLDPLQPSLAPFSNRRLSPQTTAVAAAAAPAPADAAAASSGGRGSVSCAGLGGEEEARGGTGGLGRRGSGGAAAGSGLLATSGGGAERSGNAGASSAEQGWGDSRFRFMSQTLSDVMEMTRGLIGLMEQVPLPAEEQRAVRKALRQLQAANKEGLIQMTYLTLAMAAKAGDEEEIREAFEDLRQGAARCQQQPAQPAAAAAVAGAPQQPILID
ncbi:hypothetical protein HYH03_007923 [Edaphochlamys debaryana]|uniref:Uncharacterized protein n=1 Tax=Edaphochlamys debaryana TaxID=47281 RepID=A0A835Y160_9CHLO|nr:hypothetical protein HYH03_007923 [Edaphochlamys debaryana]|eukprot:KAG2493996.1 hypothetical protein HYH03_007923 [Edaphochlamys debaryana]